MFFYYNSNNGKFIVNNYMEGHFLRPFLHISLEKKVVYKFGQTDSHLNDNLSIA